MEWYYAEDKRQKGPVTEEQFVELVRSGVIRADTLVWKQGMTAWQPYGQVSGKGNQPAPLEVTSSSLPAGSPVAFSSASFSNDNAARERALSKVKAPAICLLVYACIAAGWILMQTIGALSGQEYQPMQGLDPQAAEFAKKIQGPMQLLMIGGGAISAVIIFVGAFRMLSLKNYSLVMAASIVTFLPCICPCCVLGIPFGIWSLIVLNNTDVKGQFS